VDVEARLKALKERWNKEYEFVSKIRDVHSRIEGARAGSNGPAPAATPAIATTPAASAPAAAEPAKTDTPAAATPPSDPAALRKELARLESELATLQGESPMMRVAVDSQIVGEVLSARTGIPVGKMLKDEISTVLSLDSLLGKRVIGQAHALDLIAQRVQTSRAALDDPIKPIGVFMLIGPSGVGKTET